MHNIKSDRISILNINMVCIGFTLLLFVLTLLFRDKVNNWTKISFDLFIACIIYVTSTKIASYFKIEFVSFSIRVVAVLGLYSFLFQAVAPLQLILYDRWLDEIFVSLEIMLTGYESSIYLQRFVNPTLTEWMMFNYVLYVPLVPAVAFIVYNNAGRHKGEEYLLHIVLAYSLCYLGFIILPLASPLYFYPEMFTTSLDGGLFTTLGEWMRQTQHYAGGSLPSPHTAAGTVILITLYRYNRTLFIIFFPLILTLYISTVYGRYHYVWDAIAGIIVGLVVTNKKQIFAKYLQLLKQFVGKREFKIQPINTFYNINRRI